MNHKVIKFFNIGQHEKEEKWLNEMSARGLQLISTMGTKYEFKEGQPGEYIYRLELLDHAPSHIESKAYIQFLEDTGVEMIGTCYRWVYFRKKASEGPFDLYSDVESKMNHYKRIRGLGLCILGPWAVVVALHLVDIFKLLFTGEINWMEVGNYPNLGITVIGIVMVSMIFWMIRPVSKRIKELKKEQTINE